jgi:calcineurin-like phosphoesterase family protein
MATGRKFPSVSEMNEHMITVWNSCVEKRDIVYHLGDFGFSQKECKTIRYRLNGKIHLIYGNHDVKNNIHKTSWFTSSIPLYTLKYQKKKIVLCHYPIRCWDSSHYNSYHMYGHVHTGLNFDEQYIFGKSFDVGIDYWKRPITFEEAIKFFNILPDNQNFLGEKNVE